MHATDVVLDVEGLRGRIEDCLRSFVAAQHARSSTSEQLLIGPIADLVLGSGKRLRPAFCYWGWRGAGGDDVDAIVAAAASLELLHACALIHDDIMDRSAVRRGAPSAHRRLADIHSEHGWHGDAAQFGVAAAVTAGDLCLVWADELLRGSGLPVDVLARAGRVFDDMREETIRGQYLDLVAQASRDASIDGALRVARSKTASNTTFGPLQFGGALAGADSALLNGYAAFGEPLGIAFQLLDDLLGAFGDPARTGKPSGDDLRDGKGTVLLAQARRLGGPSGAQAVDALVARGGEATVHPLRRLLEGTGARAHVERRIAELGAQAADELSALPLAYEPARDVLGTLAAALLAIDQ